MYQEVEGQRPVIVSRNHNMRNRPLIYRWTQPPDWNPKWNFQSSVFAGLSYGLSFSLYSQLHEPASDLLRYYQSPDNLSQLRSFFRALVRMESFQTGLLTRAFFYSTYGVSFHGSRFWLWRTFAGGYPHDPKVMDWTWPKKFLTALAVGAATCWIPVPFHNVAIRFAQDQVLPREFARGYRNHLHAALSIVRHDGAYPLIRSAGPLMGEYMVQTFGLFFWYDTIKDKLRVASNFGFDFSGIPTVYSRYITVTSGVYLGLFNAYPFRMMRLWVETLPQNSQGEVAFRSYAECFWKAMGDTYNVTQLWNGFHRYFLRVGPPLWCTMWLADTLGIMDQTEFPNVYPLVDE